MRFTPKVFAILFKSLENGQTVRQSCKAAGISHVIFYRWLKRGEDESDEAFTTFRKRAIAAMEAGDRKKLKDALAALRAPIAC